MDRISMAAYCAAAGLAIWIAMSIPFAGAAMLVLLGILLWQAGRHVSPSVEDYSRIIEAVEQEPKPEEVLPVEVEVEAQAADFKPFFNALASGDLSARADVSAGDAQDICNSAMTQLNEAVGEVLALTELMSLGDLSTQANGQYKGDLAALTRNMNAVQAGLKEMIVTVSEAAAQVARDSGQMATGTRVVRETILDQRREVDGVSRAVTSMVDSVDGINSKVSQSSAAAEAALQTVAAGREAGEKADEALDQMLRNADAIGGMLGIIEGLASQTNLLAINASVEAARAGHMGRGFAVVSAEVKDLATRSAEAAGDIRQIVEATGQSVSSCSEQVAHCARYMQEISAKVDQINEFGGEVSNSCDAQRAVLDDVQNSIEKLSTQSDRSETHAVSAEEGAQSLETVAGTLNASLARFRLEDETMIDEIRARASEISRRMEQAINRGEISLEDLFARDYTEIEGSTPPQYDTPFTAVTDRLLPDILESALKISNGVVFSAAVNLDGFLPTHNRKFSNAPRAGDPVWNAANARNRRFFDDRVGLTAGTSTRDYIIQSYRRDMGGGTFVTMKDISAPIIVKGRHWGGLRIGYKPDVASDQVSVKAAA